MEQTVLTISQINEYIRNMMDSDGLLSSVAVRGEISNYKVYPSGHHYFTLKDEASALKCVMFRGNSLRLKFRPDNGMQVLAVGKISVYPRDGAYQLYCTSLIPDGVGDLHTAYEQLKAKLSAEGLFDPAHKKPIPQYPEVIGIVTSSAGAAVHDMLRILHKRYPISKVRLLPVRVQGVEAPDEICAAIRFANAHHLADLLIVGRGGGSLEDLWAFNDERVARAIYASEIPVISAVGHEPDVTISDFVADLRAATPSNGAELAVPDQNAIYQVLDSMSTAMATALTQRLRVSRRHLSMLCQSPAMKNPMMYLQQKDNTLKLLQNRMVSAQERFIGTSRKQYLSATAKLDALSPLKVLTRGYAMVQTGQGSVVRSVNDVQKNDQIHITVNDGTVIADVAEVKEHSL